jgi:hypothetical protein
MKADPRWFTHLVALLILTATFYALVLHPYVIETDVKLFLTGLSGTASLYLFGDQMQRSSASRQQAAFDKGLGATPIPTPTEEPNGNDPRP